MCSKPVACDISLPGTSPTRNSVTIMTPLEPVPNFEVLFRVPPQHRLVHVRSRSRGGPIGGTFWEHEEYDAGGSLIARFKSFEETDPTGLRVSGWHRRDATGLLLEAGDLRSPSPHPGPPFGRTYEGSAPTQQRQT